MQAIFLLIKTYRIFLLFVLLELLSFWLIIQHNTYQNAVFLNSSNQYVGTVLAFSANIRDYFGLKQVNERLAKENLYLHSELTRLRQRKPHAIIPPVTDSVVVNQYNFSLAKVVNNATNRTDNYITIDKGSRDGISKDMAVISPLGVVGKVVKVNSRFSTVISVLHSKNSVSAQVKKNGELGSIKWDGKHPRFAKMTDVPSYAKVIIGDTICTSSFNGIFPPRIMVGIVRKVRLRPEQTFYDLEIELSTPFNRLDYVYVIKNILKMEQESLETEEFEEIEEAP
jgi:rod shape-determining protein MreC